MNNLVAWFKENGYETVNHGAAALTAELGIKVKEYPENGIYVLNYCQIESPKTHPVVMECRGLIVTEDLKPVCRPFLRFFNVGEAPEITEKFEIEESVVYEKLDGSLVKVYHHEGEWHVATRGTAFAESENYTGVKFQDMIVRAFGKSSLEELRDTFNRVLNSEYSFMFEFTSPYNRVVTPYTEEKMYLLGAIHTETGDEYQVTEDGVNLMTLEGLNVAAPKTYSFKSISEMRKFANGLTGLQEGFVANDIKNGIRVKMKAETYVQVHRLRGESLPTPKRIMGLVVTNETEEYLAYFPEERERFVPYMKEWEKIQGEIDSTYQTHMNTDLQKEFAIAVKDYPFAFILFQARAKQQDPIHVLNLTDTNKKVKLLSTYMGIE